MVEDITLETTQVDQPESTVQLKHREREREREREKERERESSRREFSGN